MRTLALPAPLARALHEHKTRQTGQRMLAGSEGHDDDLVFAQPNGRPIDRCVDYKRWRNLRREAGVRHVRHVRLYDGRHTAATLLLSEGVHPRVAMKLLGHTTSGSYAEQPKSQARRAA